MGGTPKHPGALTVPSRPARRRGAASILALATGVALLAGACGSSSKSGASSTPVTSDKAPSGSPIVIGSIGDLSGAGDTSTDPQESKQSMEAWVHWTNASGGINGHPVKLIYMDDASDPAQGLADAKELVESDHVVAIVGQEALATLPAWASYMQQVHIPVIGGQPSTAPTTNPMMFMTVISNTNIVEGQPYVVKDVGDTRFAVFYNSQIAVAGQSVPLLRSAGEKLGLKMVYTAAVTQSQPNYTAQCLAAKQAGAQFVQINLGPAADAPIITSCLQQGYSPTYGNVVSVPSSTLNLIGSQGAAADMETFPVFYNSPATAAFHQALSQDAPQIGKNVSVVSAVSWTAGLVFSHAASMIKGPVTSQSLLTALYSIHNDNFGGLTAPISYGPPGHANPQVACFYLIKVENHKFVAPDGLKTQCVSPSA